MEEQFKMLIKMKEDQEDSYFDSMKELNDQLAENKELIKEKDEIIKNLQANSQNNTPYKLK
jgi:hypothetical protein